MWKVRMGVTVGACIRVTLIIKCPDRNTAIY